MVMSGEGMVQAPLVTAYQKCVVAGTGPVEMEAGSLAFAVSGCEVSPLAPAYHLYVRPAPEPCAVRVVEVLGMIKVAAAVGASADGQTVTVSDAVVTAFGSPVQALVMRSQ